MKKKLLNILLFLISIALIFPAIIQAGDFSLISPKAIYTEGEVFLITIKIEPKEDTIYTSKIKLNYPADLVEIQSFSFGENWLPLTQPEYDLIDNTNGILIKTAGYPGGVSSSKTFGTIKFSAKKSGSAEIKVSKDSLILNADNQNVFIGTEIKLFLTLKEKPLPPPKPIEEKEEKPKLIEEKGEEIIESPITEEEITLPKTIKKEELTEKIVLQIPPVEETKLKAGLLASLVVAIGEITHSIFLTFITILCLAGLVFIGIREWYLFRKRRNKVYK